MPLQPSICKKYRNSRKEIYGIHASTPYNCNMRYFLLSIILVTAISLIFLLVLRGLGYAFHWSLGRIKPLKIRLVVSPKIDYPIIGIFVIVVVAFYSAHFNLNLVTIFRGLFLVSLVGLVLDVYQNKIKDLKDYLLYNTIGVWVVLPQLFISGQKNGSNPVISLGNHDIAYYLAAANQFLNSGFIDRGLISLNDLNSAARAYQYFTPTALFSFDKANSPLWIGQFATAKLVLFVTLTSLIVSEISKIIAPRLNTFQRFAISIVFSLVSINLYILSNFFLAQAIAMMIILRIMQKLLNEIIYKKDLAMGKLDLLEIALMVLCLYTYPALLIPALTILIVGLGLDAFRVKSRPSLVRLAISISVALFSTWYYIPTAINLFKLLQAGNFGWPLSPLSPIALLLTPGLISAPFSASALILMWGFFYFFVFMLIRKVTLSKLEKLLMVAMFLGSFVFVIAFAEIRGQGYGSYGIWKLQSYLAPIMILVLFSYCLRKKSFFDSALNIFLGVVILNPFIIWTVNSGTSTGNTFMSLYSSSELTSSKNLNVDLKDFSETMLATTLGNKGTIFLNSNSYLQTSLDPNACTLTNTGNQGYSYSKAINKDYVLASQNPSRCSQWLTLRPKEKIYFNSMLKKRFGSGWWESETWGSWARTNEAYVYLEVDHSKYQPNMRLRFTLNSLLDESGNPMRLSIFVNGISYILDKEMEHSKPQTVDIELKGKSVQEGTFLIKLVSNNLVIPAATNVSTDSRSLGIGLISVETF